MHVRAKGLFIVPFIVAFVFTAWLLYEEMQSEDLLGFTPLGMIGLAALPFVGVYLMTFIISLFIASIRK